MPSCAFSFSLAHAAGPGRCLAWSDQHTLECYLQAIRAKLKDEQAVDAECTRLVFLLQLHACTFRRAIRQAVKRIVLDLRERTRGNDKTLALSAEEECTAACSIADLLAATSTAVTNLEQACEQGLLHLPLPKECRGLGFRG